MTAFLSLMLSACGQSAPPQQTGGPPPSVVTDLATLQDLAEERSFTGRIEAIDKVQIRARVQGFLKARNYVEGAEVKEGDLLFEIEPDSFQIAVKQAEANLESASAGVTLAQQTFDRAEELAQKGSGSRANLDTARSGLIQAQASLKARQSELETAKLNLSYTRITAPMHGRVGRAAASVGNLVGPDSGVLALLVKQDPVYVTFPVPQWLLLQVRKAGQASDQFFIRLRLPDGSTYEPRGTIAFADVQGTATTDSITVRGRIANADGLLVDQQLVNVFVVRKAPDRKLMISQSALLLDQQGPYVLAVPKDNKVAIKRITTGEQHGPLIVVENGLEAGERVIVGGHQKARPGSPVTPQQAANENRTPSSSAPPTR